MSDDEDYGESVEGFRELVVLMLLYMTCVAMRGIDIGCILIYLSFQA